MRKLSLQGKLVVITRSVKGSEPWIKYLKKRGATTYSFPTIEIIPADLTPVIVKILGHISNFDWVIFTSAAGFRSFKKLAINISPARMPKIAVVGEATAKAVRAMGYRVAFQPSTPASAALAWELELVRGRSILLLRTAIASRDLRDVLTVRGGKVTDLPIYKTVLRRDPDPKFAKLLASGRIDCITFASPSAVRGFLKRLQKGSIGKISIDQARMIPAIAIGPSVVAILKKGGFKTIRMAKRPTIEAVIAAVGGVI